MVGSAVCRRLEREPVQLLAVTKNEIDLRDTAAVSEWLCDARPDAVIMAAAKVGGIHANQTYPVDFLQDNLMIQNAVISAAHAANVERFVFLGSSCIYPKLATQPINENALLSGPLEPTNEPYALAKIAGIKLVEAYRSQYKRDWVSAMPTNLYGPGDNYHPENSHVLPALLRRFHEAKIHGHKQVTIWGDGTPLREFMHVDDLADGLVFVLQHYSQSQHINIGSGEEISIQKLSEIIREVVGVDAEIHFDASKPNGTPRKLMDSSKIKDLGWTSKIPLDQGIRATYESLKASEVFN